ncbi:MAG: agmatine deiminase [Erysipelotrichaceae bacterium]
MAKRIIDTTPLQDGFVMPGEFEEHAQTWMVWPERCDNWRLGAKPAQHAFVEVAKTIARFEPVTMCVSKAQYANARALLPSEVRIVEMSNDDAWMRDMGATFVKHPDGRVRGVDWSFNAWGGLVDGLYFPWDQDDAAAQKMCELERLDSYRVNDFVLEGGSIHVDGDGTCVVTEACLLSEGRNPDLSKEEITAKLKAYLGVETVIWLPRGIYLDETNEHVDNIFQFVKPGECVLAWCDDKNDPQYELSHMAYDVLANSKDAKGRSLKIHKLHIPSTVLISEEESKGVDAVDGTLPRNPGDRQAASYVNFYVCNGAVILPGFDDPIYDQLAKEKLEQIYEEREVVQVYAREIILGGGNIHCITQQQPK